MIFNKLIPELSVSNLNKSMDFYKNCGFKIEYERLENKFAFISLEGSQLMIQELSQNDKWGFENLHYPFGNGVNFQIEVANVEQIYKKVLDNNYSIAFEMEENWYRENDKLLGNKEFLVQDPDGYLLRFCQDLGEREV